MIVRVSAILQLSLLLGLTLLIAACAPSESPAPEPAVDVDATAQESPLTAMAVLGAREGSAVSGTVRFEQAGGETVIVADITGLEPGKNGFHIHETGDCSAPDFTSAGGHFNPLSADHGAPGSGHIGDLGNLETDADGHAQLRWSLAGDHLGEGETSIVGRAVVVHEGEDDLTSQPSGDAGPRLACGVIELD